jgi:hypothetical protein
MRRNGRHDGAVLSVDPPTVRLGGEVHQAVAIRLLSQNPNDVGHPRNPRAVEEGEVEPSVRGRQLCEAVSPVRPLRWLGRPPASHGEMAAPRSQAVC